jgi:hypothetical protein
MNITTEEMYRFHLDSKRSIAGYRQRKMARPQKKLGKSRAGKDKAISLLAALTAAPLIVQSFA